MTFGDKLRELRTAKGWTQKELADLSGFAQSAIARWEAGQQIPAFDSVKMLCDVLGKKCTVFEDCEFVATPKAAPAAKPKPKKKGGK